MKLFGDVPDTHKELAAALELQERKTDVNETGIPREFLAKAYVCLAHDWYQMSADDEGLRLLAKAEQIYPGYFKTMIAKHCYADSDFEFLVRNITAELVLMLLEKLEDKRQ